MKKEYVECVVNGSMETVHTKKDQIAMCSSGSRNFGEGGQET